MELAKGDGIAVVLVGHVTKDGSIAGPKTLEHLVDAVLTLEGERYAGAAPPARDEEPLRLDRGGRRLRDGRGGLREVADPARAFLVEHDGAGAGQRRRADPRGQPAAARRGPGARRARPATGRRARTASGVDPNRLALLVAVLGRRAGIGLGSHDVYANLAGGLTVDEPGLDLPLALALASSLRDRPVAAGDRRDRRGRPARRAAAVPGSSGGCARPPGSGSRRAIVPRGRRAAPPRPTSPGLEIVAVGDAARGDRARRSRTGPDAGAWRVASPARC